MDYDINAVSERLKTQDNRATQNPMFCVQEKKRDVGIDQTFTENRCWHNASELETVYDDDPNFKEPEGDDWEQYGYNNRWETVMVAFTEEGAKEYIHLNGHNHQGELQIYVESFRRCPEMIAIREYLIALTTKKPI